MIEAQGSTRRFGKFTVVDVVSLRVSGGAILALLGRNGAGKTTVRMHRPKWTDPAFRLSVCWVDVAAVLVVATRR